MSQHFDLIVRDVEDILLLVFEAFSLQYREIAVEEFLINLLIIKIPSSN